MTQNRTSLGFAALLSAGLNAVLFLIIAWILAVSRGLAVFQNPAVLPTLAPKEAPPEITVVVTSAPAPEPAVRPPEKLYIQAPEDQAEAAPEKATRFLSSRNMRAATEKAPEPGGVEGLATKDGIDMPFLDLRDADFKDGEKDRPPASPKSATTPQAEAAAESPQTPPEPARREKTSAAATVETQSQDSSQPETPVTEETGDAPSSDSVPENFEKNPATPSKIAFRDSFSESPASLETPPDSAPPRPLTKRPFPEMTRRAQPPPLTRIPDRVPEIAYRSGQRKTKSLGTITSRGARSSMDASSTLEGKFYNTLKSVVEKKWNRGRLSLGGLTGRGMVTIDFEVDSRGRISNVKLTNPGEANPVMQDCALAAVINAKLPLPPAELFPAVNDSFTKGKIRFTYNFISY